MRTFRSITLDIFLAALFTISAIAQTGGGQAAAPGRVYVVNPNMFGDEKAGITKYVAGMTLLTKEFAPAQAELQLVANRIQTLAAELKTLQQQATTGSVPVDQAAARAKTDEYERLQREFKFKQEDAKARYGKRESAVMGPIRLDIGKGLAEFAKKNGYWMILDASKMDEVGAFLTIDENADVTKAFTAFYNARP